MTRRVRDDEFSLRCREVPVGDVDRDLLFPLGAKLTAKVLETGEGKLRLSLRAVKEDEERSEFEGFRANVAAQSGLGTFADLLRGKK